MSRERMVLLRDTVFHTFNFDKKRRNSGSSDLLLVSVFSLYSRTVNCPSPYTVGLLPLLLDWWPSPYTIGLLPILLAFSLYCWPSPYILLAFSLYYWPSPYSVGLVECGYVGLLPVLFKLGANQGVDRGWEWQIPALSNTIHCIWTTTVYSVHTGTGLHIRWVWPKQLQQLEDITSHAHIPGCSQCYCSEHCDCTVQSKRPADPV